MQIFIYAKGGARVSKPNCQNNVTGFFCSQYILHEGSNCLFERNYACPRLEWDESISLRGAGGCFPFENLFHL